MVGAGYILYSSSVTMVISIGNGVQAFTLNTVSKADRLSL